VNQQTSRDPIEAGRSFVQEYVLEVAGPAQATDPQWHEDAGGNHLLTVRLRGRTTQIIRLGASSLGAYATDPAVRGSYQAFIAKVLRALLADALEH